MARRKIVGEARIPLEEWVILRQQAAQAESQVDKMKKVLHQVEVFLSFISKEKAVYDAIPVFNAQSDVAVIHLSDNRVKIELIDEAEEDSPSS